MRVIPDTAVAVLEVAGDANDRRTCSGYRANGNPSVDRCIAGRRAHRKGLFGLRGPSLRGRAAGWCGARFRTVEDREECADERVAQLIDEGYREAFFGTNGPDGRF